MKCPYFDCGWCYAETNLGANADNNGACLGSDNCSVAGDCEKIHVVTDNGRLSVINDRFSDDSEEHW